jgi:gliding motility-associated-like protein
VITIPSRAPINININPVQELRLGTSLTFTPIVQGPFPIVSYSWTPSEGLSCTDCPNPEVNPAVNTIYTLTVTDANGCTAEANVDVNLNTKREIYIPNAFSPNADDINDFFRVYSGPGVASISAFQIFDRWGNLVWEGNNLAPSPDGSDGWDGTYLGRPADPGVYVYAIEILFLDGRVITYRGDVALVNGLVKN